MISALIGAVAFFVRRHLHLEQTKAIRQSSMLPFFYLLIVLMSLTGRELKSLPRQ